jgi:hypothetical protein
MRSLAAVLTALGLLAAAGLAAAYNCPVVIRAAEEAIKKAEAKATPETRPFLDEARKQLAEARAHHENAKSKRDHADAVRKARVATAFAEEALVLSGP